MSFKGTGPRKHRIAGKLRFRRTDVEAWIASRAEPASRAS
jgi:predicted DNA-binding transcriptional regulator AlpA